MTSLSPPVFGAERSFERLYREHADSVYRYTLGALGDPRDAEDATQSTFLNAYRAFDRGERVREPAAWLIAIARNVCRQRYREQARRPREVELPRELAQVGDEPPAFGAVLDAVRRLGFRQRAAFVLSDLEGRPLAEIAAALGVSTAAAEMLVIRARLAVRELLEEDLSCVEA